MASKKSIGLGVAALAAGAGVVAATRGKQAEKKKVKRAASEAARKEYRNTELGKTRQRDADGRFPCNRFLRMVCFAYRNPFGQVIL